VVVHKVAVDWTIMDFFRSRDKRLVSLPDGYDLPRLSLRGGVRFRARICFGVWG
jgi:hypothetical protein